MRVKIIVRQNVGNILLNLICRKIPEQNSLNYQW